MSEAPFKVLYDGQCPFCRREARWLQRRDRRGCLAFEDISAPGFNPQSYGLTLEEVQGVIHGVLPDGRVVREVEVFRQAYRRVGLGWLVAPTGWPVLRWISRKLYRLFARHRVALGRLVCGSGAASRCAVSSDQPSNATRP